ncbi:MAG: UDP-N-acetylglucosamine 2-epimerase (non-hydrolyzing) [Bacteroidetes bacterium]|nr:MAG: UDP-N-acetylglucosamine 2-epimerase (non-hydrolyzing) [Bacteroidota bacterium]
MPTILTILGARPQFIKASALTRSITRRGDLEFKQIILHTGQHYDALLSDIFFNELNLPKPEFKFLLKSEDRKSRLHEMKVAISEAILICKPDAVLVYGDTDSTLAGAQAANELGLPVIHVEAGLRSFDLEMPEEINRVATDKISSVLIAPTTTAVRNLNKEGIFGAFHTGDIMHDNAIHFTRDLVLEKAPSILLTMHRPSNVDSIDRLKSWIDSIGEWCCKKGLMATFPIHPRTKKSLISLYGEVWSKELEKINIKAVLPVGYIELLKLIKGSSLVITDSGGIQKEAYSCETPSVVIRRNTEWVELVNAGHTVLCPEPNQLSNLADRQNGRVLDVTDFLYGNGNAADEILDIISNALF